MPLPRRRRKPAPDGAALRDLGERIRTTRTAAHMSQTQLGAPHFTRAYVSAVELGKIRPSMRSLEFLAGRLGVPMASLVTSADDLAHESASESIAGDPLAEARGLLTRGIAERSLADIERGLELAADVDDPAALAARYEELAATKRRAGDNAGALAPLRRAIALRAYAQDRGLVADARRTLATSRARRATPRPSPRS
ncbi:MAG TPA: helix-turn-helix transcriptional regulator [Candidatus Dormibacteraeota bacterium]|nr:helix-turn-helix transcriptional regulator [Candidatus Dormibacteraeota bacterium]